MKIRRNSEIEFGIDERRKLAKLCVILRRNWNQIGHHQLKEAVFVEYYGVLEIASDFAEECNFCKNQQLFNLCG